MIHISLRFIVYLMGWIINYCWKPIVYYYYLFPKMFSQSSYDFKTQKNSRFKILHFKYNIELCWNASKRISCVRQRNHILLQLQAEYVCCSATIAPSLKEAKFKSRMSNSTLFLSDGSLAGCFYRSYTSQSARQLW